MMSADKLTSNGVNFSTVGTEGRKKLVSLLDSGATQNIVKDPELLSKIWTISEVLDVETNYDIKRYYVYYSGNDAEQKI